MCNKTGKHCANVVSHHQFSDINPRTSDVIADDAMTPVKVLQQLFTLAFFSSCP